MTEKAPSPNKKRSPETVARWYRNVNALGAVAFIGAAAILPPAAPVLYAGAGINALQAAGGEIARRAARGKKS